MGKAGGGRTDGGGGANGGRGGDDETGMVCVLIFGFFLAGLLFLFLLWLLLSRALRLLSRLASVSFIVWVCAKIVGPSARLMTEAMSLRTALVSSEEWSQRGR